MVSIKKYYVVCPSNTVTGGPDALHQLVFYMRKNGFDCVLAYIADKKAGLKIPDPYKIYVNDFTLFKKVKDNENNIIIIPETQSFLSKKFRKSPIFIWWLSVDNNEVKKKFLWKIWFILSFPFRVLKHKNNYQSSFFSKLANTIEAKKYDFTKENSNVFHLCASYYALDFICKNSHRPYYKCIEPISFKFLSNYKKWKDDRIRNDVILYNPKKSKFIVDVLKEKCSKLKFLALENMTQDELVATYSKAKLYIDFGPFPGAERIPKEAVLYGCAIITGKHGASFYYGDVPVSNEYKFDEKCEIEKIIEKINFILMNYDKCINDFNEYKNTVLGLETNFENSLNDIFGK